jgi:hypothetical protein
MAELWLVCEGEPGSVDVALLQQVFADVLAAEIVVEPACGSNLSPVARFLESHRGGTAAFVHDRDYRPRAEAETALVDGEPGFLWRRHSIENYLLPPPIILQAFQNLRERFEQQRRGGVPTWFAAIPADPELVAESLRECARSRAAEEACRLANHRLWDTLPPSLERPQKRNPPAPGTGDPSDWREALCQEAERVCRAAAQTAECASFHRDAVIVLFDTAYAEITADSYVLDMEFLIDFHGRDLLKAFHQWLGSHKVPLSYKRLCDELIPAAVRQYGENRAIYGNDDFRDLANGVRSLAGLAPLA